MGLMLKLRFQNMLSLRRTINTASVGGSTLLKVEQINGLRKITMSDTKTRNALSMQMMDELISNIERNQSDERLRSIMITSVPGPVFSAGHNLKELTSNKGIDQQRAIFAKCNQLMITIRKSEVPVFAVVYGLAAAAGCQLVAACDFAIATEKAKFSTPGANFGVFCSTPGISVARSVNRSLAAYMVLTGLPLNSQEALQAGLVSKVFPEDTIEDSVQQIHNSIRSKSRSIIKLGKEFFYKQIEMGYEEALKEGAEVMVQNLQYQDSQEGLDSFKEKRKPVWSHTDDKVKM
ncbi:enoyl-CoA hydratase domain-containing protein 3, mitochondrial [Folsomia candida]|uniref:Enoyl-CoA hydratase domain-containing protein 3, mitochondrial n=1 Tax=Folsomia candida TaxID=158441 RepID=A0A226E4R9_FOLCA|nr:enoyl-CoA hydratase domain-containing protein 3, mitochondrial [Folsomia candida]XP_021956619.1 enoyl-CoA hydratase domain-containing protein 3, mitochondrial [Folsomia candida]XP_021956620.1 enoyl-CoA hydratase domain-containing protein 3, mitochondrial [Folsomia candida]OXA51901.1 Enoyl-CoA hydratase domain-containing protein 3, mitochondrial [Folsomia candida]